MKSHSYIVIPETGPEADWFASIQERAKPKMNLVVIESPFAPSDGKNETLDMNVTYARRAMADCFKRGEAPYASHLLYTQPWVLDDTIPSERSLGMRAGFHWGDLAAYRVVYIDRGVSKGMEAGIERAKKNEQPVVYRSLTPGANQTDVQKHHEQKYKTDPVTHLLLKP